MREDDKKVLGIVGVSAKNFSDYEIDLWIADSHKLGKNHSSSHEILFQQLCEVPYSYREERGQRYVEIPASAIPVSPLSGCECLPNRC
jgi:hypothetical protein